MQRTSLSPFAGSQGLACPLPASFSKEPSGDLPQCLGSASSWAECDTHNLAR